MLISILNEVGADLTDKVTFEQRCEGVSHVAVEEKAFQIEGKQVPRPCGRKNTGVFTEQPSKLTGVEQSGPKVELNEMMPKR